MTTDPTGGPDLIRAPWTPEQVDALNRFQRFGGMHPFTCGAEHSQGTPHLVALEDGWHCWLPWCDYRQNWAHAFMADPEALPDPANPNSADPAAFRHAVAAAPRATPATMDGVGARQEPSPLLARIRSAWASADDAANRFAELGMNPWRLQRIIDGQQPPNTTDLALIATACGVTVGWLAGGTTARTETGPTIATAQVGVVVAEDANEDEGDGMRRRYADALRAAAYSCDGDCGGDEATCVAVHPIQEAATSHGVISEVYGPIDAIAEVVAGVRDAEMERLRATNRRLNLRCQQAESRFVKVTRAVADWEIGERRTYVSLSSLNAIAKAVGVEIDTTGWELHGQRVKALGIQLAAVRALHSPSSFPNPDAPGVITYCVGCDEGTGSHPCPTIDVLDGPESTP